jgi:hypothetical protein
MADAPATTRTRTRRASSAKADTTAAENDTAAAQAAEKAAEDAAKKEARDKEAAEKKAEREAEAAAKKEQKEKEKAEAKAAKEAERASERQALIDSGDLIEVEDDDSNVTTFVTSEPKKDAVAQRALEVIEVLKADGREIPVAGKELADRFGGGTVQWVAFFGMLRVLGLVKVYRFRTGERGGSGLSYLWIGD